MNGEEVCINCSSLEGQDVQVTSYVPITPFLNRMIKEQKLLSLDKVTVQEFLRGLYWRVTMVSQ